MTNNFEKIKSLFRFDLGSYHVQIIQRSKDGHNKASRLVAEWFVTSLDKLDFLMQGIESLCNTYNARCYINLNPKSDEEVCWKMTEAALISIKTKSFAPLSLLSHAHDSCNGNEVRYWIVDIDNRSTDLYKLSKEINTCQSGFDGINVIACVPTKSGHHLITVPFDLSKLVLPPDVEIKKNASTILYCP